MYKCPGILRVLGSFRSPEKNTGVSEQRASHPVRAVGRDQMVQGLVDADVGFIFDFKYNMKPLCNMKSFRGGSDDKESACNAGDPSLIPESERYPGEGNGNPLQYSCLENFIDRGAWWLQSMGSQRVRHN